MNTRLVKALCLSFSTVSGLLNLIKAVVSGEESTKHALKTTVIPCPKIPLVLRLSKCFESTPRDGSKVCRVSTFDDKFKCYQGKRSQFVVTHDLNFDYFYTKAILRNYYCHVKHYFHLNFIIS